MIYIAINNAINTKFIYLKISKTNSIYKKYPETQSHPIFYGSSLQLKRSKSRNIEIWFPNNNAPHKNKKGIFRYSCNVYECPPSANIKFLPISNGVIPQFSLFGCADIGNGCISTVIPNAKYLIMLNFSTDVLKTIKDIKVEYQKQPNY